MFAENPLRFKKGYLQTATYELEHPQTDSRISLVGVMHMGEQAYYNAVSAYAEKQEMQHGAEVHYEKLKTAPAEALSEASEEERELVEQLRGASGAVRALARHLDCVYQSDAFSLKPHWQNHDINHLQLVQLLGTRTAAKLFGKQNGGDLEAPEGVDPKLAAFVARSVFRFAPLFNRLKPLITSKHVTHVIRDYRNGIALQAAKSRLCEEPNQSIVAIWGAGHLPGLEAGFKQMNYKRSRTLWLDVCRL